MKIKGLMAAMGLAGAAMSLPAFAQMNPPSLSAAYVGAEIGQADHKFDCNQFGGTSCDSKDTAYRLFLGYQFHRAFSVEGAYTNLGSPTVTETGGTFSADVGIWDLSVIGAIPVGPVSIYGRLGGYHSTTEADDVSHDKFGWLVGAGVGWDFNKNVGLRAEWKRYLNTGGGEFGQNWDADMLSIAGVWRFR